MTPLLLMKQQRYITIKLMFYNRVVTRNYYTYNKVNFNNFQKTLHAK